MTINIVIISDIDFFFFLFSEYSSFWMIFFSTF